MYKPATLSVLAFLLVSCDQQPIAVRQYPTPEPVNTPEAATPAQPAPPPPQSPPAAKENARVKQLNLNITKANADIAAIQKDIVLSAQHGNSAGSSENAKRQQKIGRIKEDIARWKSELQKIQ